MTYEIRTLAEGEVISENGFYNISLDTHHNQPCDAPSVTSGVLRKMELATPADVWATHKLNPDRWPSKDSPALWLGRAMAAYVENGMEAVEQEFLILPEKKPRKPTAPQIAAFEKTGVWSDAAAEGAEFWGKVEADGRTPLTDAEITMITDMGGVLAKDEGASAAMGGVPEITMAVKDIATEIWILSRPDTVSFDGMTSDYKKMNTQGRPFNYRVVDAAITKFGYHMQGALACDTFEILTSNKSDFGIVAQWDQAPHHVILREISEEDLGFGSFQNRRALTRFAECLDSGYWPGPGEDIAAYQMPEWMRTRLLEEMQTAGQAP